MVVAAASYQNFKEIQVPNLEAEQLTALERFSVHIGQQPNTFLSAADTLSESGSGKLFEIGSTFIRCSHKYCGHICLYEKTWFFHSCPTAFNERT